MTQLACRCASAIPRRSLLEVVGASNSALITTLIKDADHLRSRLSRERKRSVVSHKHCIGCLKFLISDLEPHSSAQTTNRLSLKDWRVVVIEDLADLYGVP